MCNGCTDRTADVARRYGNRVRVIETPKPSKTAALNLGDARVSGFPRFYVDADVVLPIASIRRIAARLVERGALAASPVMDLDLRGVEPGCPRLLPDLDALPYVREGMIGVGVYALSEEGRATLRRVPRVIADDGYVRMLFSASERIRVDDAPVRVYAPAASLRPHTHQDPEPPRPVPAAGSASPTSSPASGRRSPIAAQCGRS